MNVNSTIIDSSPSREAIRNSCEIRLIAMRRSGSHAFLNWLASLYKDKICFINDLPDKRFIYKAQPSEDLPSLPLKKRVPLSSLKNLLVYNFEDINLEQSLPNQDKLDQLKGISGKLHTFLLLRDPYNLFASRLQLRRRDPLNEFTLKVAPPTIEGIQWQQKMWIQYAKEFLTKTCYLGKNVVPVSYNRWLLDCDYRKSLAEEVGCAYHEEGFKQVSEYGFGSSFGDFPNRIVTDSLPLLTRWKTFLQDEEFLQMIENVELKDLSYQIFGSDFLQV